MSYIRHALILTLVSQLSACAVMSKSECLTANWYQVGYEVGMDGDRKISEAFNKRERVCADHGAQADWTAFKSGHNQGIDQYCDVGNAVTLGARGRRHAITNNICPELQYPGFSRAFNDGYEYYRLKQYWDEAAYELRCLEDDVHRYRRERHNLKDRINSGKLTAYDESQAQNRRKYLRREINALRYEMGTWRSRVNNRHRQASKYADYLRAEYSEDAYEAVIH